MNATFTAPTISCGGCARNVKAALGRQPGVTGVDVEVPTKRVTVSYDDALTSPDAIGEALAEAGYPVVLPQPAEK